MGASGVWRQGRPRIRGHPLCSIWYHSQHSRRPRPLWRVLIWSCLKMTRFTLVLLSLGACMTAQSTERSHGRSMVIATGGIVATSQVLASQAGAMILAQGGSAVDAAIAANAVLGVI